MNSIEDNNLFKNQDISKEEKKKIKEQMNNSICKIKRKDGKYSTGFFLTIKFPDMLNLLNVLIIDYNILEKYGQIKEQKIIVKLNENEKEFEIFIDQSRKFFIYKYLNIAIIEIKKSDELNIKSFLKINEDIYLNNINEIF